MTLAYALLVWLLRMFVSVRINLSQTIPLDVDTSLMANPLLASSPTTLMYHIAPLLLLIISAYIVAELNIRHSLLRVRSRMVSCTFIMFMLMSGVSNVFSLSVILCFVISIALLLDCYQNRQATGRAYFLFMSLGISSMLWVQTLFFVPVLLILMVSPIYCFSVKTLSASLFGLLTPYWIAGAVMVYLEQTDIVVAHFSQLNDLPPIADYRLYDVFHYAAYAIIVIAMLTGTVNFLRFSFLDKIHVRTSKTVFIILSLIIATLLAVFPSQKPMLMPMLAFTAAPMWAHFVAHTSTRLSNLTFVIGLILSFILTLVVSN